MKTELRIESTRAGFVIRRTLPVMTRARTSSGEMVDLSGRYGSSEIQIGRPFRTREEAARAMEKLKVRATKVR